MTYQLNQNQFFNDLETILLITKNKLNKCIYHHLQYNNLIQKQKLIDKQFIQIIAKYCAFHLKEQHKQYKYQQNSTIQRFLCRVKEIMQKAIVFIPKTSVQTTKNINKIILFTTKTFHSNELDKQFLTLLDLISQIGSNNSIIKQSCTQALKRQQQQIDFKYYKSHSLNLKPLNEAELFQKSNEKYKIIDIDNDYLRRQYFDLKEDKDNLIYNAILTRNRYIKSIINNYEKRYQNYRESQNIKPRKQYNQTIRNDFSEQIEKKVVQESLKVQNRFHTSRSLIKKYTNRDKNYQNVDYFNNPQISLRNYRNIYQQKIKNQKLLVKVNNLTILNNQFEDNNTPVASNSKGNASKRLQFFKKSQEQIRLRYKYYNYNDIEFNKKKTKKGNSNMIKMYGSLPHK